MNLKEKCNLEWIYKEFVNDNLTEDKVRNLLRYFRYNHETREALLECMIDQKEENDLDFWLNQLEKDFEVYYKECTQ